MWKKYKIGWPAPAGAADAGSIRIAGTYEAGSAPAALRMARKENRDSYGDSKDMRRYRKSMRVVNRKTAEPSEWQPRRNPRKVKGKSTTLRNMASVTIRKLPNGVVKITGRKMAERKARKP